jgi:MATE family multidrug resistance protein
MPLSRKIKNFLPAYRELIKLGLPILVGQLGMIVVGFADNIMVGNYSTPALASASFVNSVFNVAVFCCLGFTYGLTPLIGALFGSDKPREIGAITRLGLWINIAYTMLISLVMGIIYLNLDHLGQPAELLPLVRPYYILFLCGMIPLAIFNAMAQWSYGINNSSLPMWIILATNILNVVGNYALIYGHFGLPELGLTGAGISTLTARVVSAVAILAFFFFDRRFSPYRLGFLHQAGRPGDARLIWRTGLPVSMQMSFESGSFTAGGIIAGLLGTAPLAAYQIIVIVGTLGFCIYYSIGSAITVKVSNASGTGNRAQMRHMAWAGYHIMLALMTTSSLIFIFGGRWLMSTFTTDPVVLSLAVSLIVPLVLYQLGDATQITFAGALRGTSQVMSMLWIAFVSYIIVGIPATYILAIPAHLGTYGIILSFSVSLLLAGALFLTHFLRATRATKA